MIIAHYIEEVSCFIADLCVIVITRMKTWTRLPQPFIGNFVSTYTTRANDDLLTYLRDTLNLAKFI